MKIELEKKRLEFSAETEKQRNDIAIANEAEVQKLKAAQFENTKMEAQNLLAAEAEVEQQEFEERERLLEIQGRLFTPQVLKAKLIET